MKITAPYATRSGTGLTPQRLTTALVCLLLTATCPLLQAQTARIVEWSENTPQNDSNHIALGYPVPVPVDTPLPFDGFRSYAGLHTRHQDLMASTAWVHGFEVGQTLAGSAIWAYQLGDENLLTLSGLPEQAMLTNGGIHAREWQSPEVVTGIMELLTENGNDNYLYRYLLDNANVIVIPVLNVDGFRQTQRFATSNWLGTDPNDPQNAPRDGRMRRKNMRQVDEDILTQEDHLSGIDLNRNNAPYWNTNPNRSSGNVSSLVHHGAGPMSEPETQALETAVLLAPAGQLSLYTDVHSFSQVHFWVRNSNDRLANQTESVLRGFSGHHAAFPANKYYGFNTANAVARNQGIGSTDEYFTHTYQVPAWTLEVEPGNAGGADYGGLARNGHDGFILPESQIRRVRTELAQSFALSYYRQSGPPAIASVLIADQNTGAVVFEASWDTVSPSQRQLYSHQFQAIALERPYTAWIAFDKPMRWRTDGQVTSLPGQPPTSLDVDFDLSVDGVALTTEVLDVSWLDMPGPAPYGYHRYRDDTLAIGFTLPADNNNQGIAGGNPQARLQLATRDMTHLQIDSDPATVARWHDGGWAGYEDSAGQDLTDSGGSDASVSFEVSSDPAGNPFVIQPGTSSAWYDPQRNGEGFVMEILPAGRAVMYWFTYDDTGRQDWYIAVGAIQANRIEFNQLLQVSGGEFGPGFNPAKVTESVVGSAVFSWSGCDQGVMVWELNRGDDYRKGRMNLQRLSSVLGLGCSQMSPPPAPQQAGLSGSWFDPTHAGEGYTLELLSDGRALVYWFSFDANGERRWFFGIGELAASDWVFDDLLTTQGGKFGAAFQPGDVEELSWGSLRLELDCSSGKAVFEATEPGFPAGRLNLQRLTTLDGLACP